MSEAPRRRGRPRREGADEEILSIARVALREKDYRDFTVDEVAARAGVAKTTVYRRWPSKAALAAAVVAPLVADVAAAEDLPELLRRLAALLAGEAGAIVAGLVGDGEGDAVAAPLRARLQQIDGQLDFDLVTGPLWSRLLVARSPMDDDQVRNLIQLWTR